MHPLGGMAIRGGPTIPLAPKDMPSLLLLTSGQPESCIAPLRIVRIKDPRRRKQLARAQPSWMWAFNKLLGRIPNLLCNSSNRGVLRKTKAPPRKDSILPKKYAVSLGSRGLIDL